MTKIELGKRYVTRDGRKVIIYSVNSGSSRCVHGAVEGNDGYFICHWHENGRSSKLYEHDLDLIECPFLKEGCFTVKSGNYCIYIKQDGAALTVNNGDNRATIHLTKDECIELANILSPPAEPEIPTSVPPPRKRPEEFNFFRRNF
jgi:hypothetical protein